MTEPLSAAHEARLRRALAPYLAPALIRRILAIMRADLDLAAAAEKAGEIGGEHVDEATLERVRQLRRRLG